MTTGSLRIGTVGYPVKNRQRVLESVSIVELTDGRQVPPSGKTVRKWRSSAPDGVGFSVQMSGYLFEAPGEGVPVTGDLGGYGDLKISEENVSLWKRGIEYAREVDARAVVLITPSQLTPSPANRDRISAFLSAVERPRCPIAWEPHGPWEIEQAARFAAENDLVLAVDPLRDEPPAGPFAYFRLGPFAAMGSRVGLYDLERLAEAASVFEEAICVFDTPRALDDAKNLIRFVSGFEVDDDI